MQNGGNNCFVWTKIGDDAGEGIIGILARKEAERQGGSIWWGIGSSLDRRKLQNAFNACRQKLPILFSTQISMPKKCGHGGMRLWIRWKWPSLDNSETFQIPEHAMVISKGRTKRYWALVCNTDDNINCLQNQPFDEQLFRNYPDGKAPGNSQNTALLTGNLNVNHSGGRYTKGFWAVLVEPRFVRLDFGSSRLLTEEEESLIANWNGIEYPALVRRIRGKRVDDLYNNKK